MSVGMMPGSMGQGMMYPYGGWHGRMMPGMQGMHDMQSMQGMGGMNPYAGMAPFQDQAQTQGQNESGLKPFDSSKMKAGRMGHYGYLEGRELAGPPPGYLPAGVQPHQASTYAPQSVTSQSPPSGHPGPYSVAQSAPSSGYYPAASAAGTAPTQKTSWTESSSVPRARYDGSSVKPGYIQANLQSLYPRTKSGGSASAWTRYGEDGGPLELGAGYGTGINGRFGPNHERLGEGRV